jgi:hypothetical protein
MRLTDCAQPSDDAEGGRLSTAFFLAQIGCNVLAATIPPLYFVLESGGCGMNTRRLERILQSLTMLPPELIDRVEMHLASSDDGPTPETVPAIRELKRRRERGQAA